MGNDNRESADNRPTQPLWSISDRTSRNNSKLGDPGQGRGRGRHRILWGIGAAAAVLIGGGALAAASGPGSAASSASQGASLSAMLNSANPAISLAALTSATGTTAPPGAGHAHRCASGAAAVRAAGHPRLARRVGALCRGRAARLRLLLDGIHGQVTFQAKNGQRTTLAFERGTITAVSGTGITVQAPDGTSMTWRLVSDSVIRQGRVNVGATHLAAGQRVFAGGPVVSGADNARLIVIRPAK
ncbi:MAG: hypothetical protein ACRDNZ_01830 [Streptosporangiaceae bacterium]